MMKTAKTYAHGEPNREVGGGTPDVVVRLTVESGRATLRVLHAPSDGGCATLGYINRRDGRGNQPVQTHDVYDIDHVADADPIESLRSATTRYGWREVTADSPWWDGVRFVSPTD